MSVKLSSALRWGRFNAILGIIMSIGTLVGCLPIGIVILIAYLKLNGATDALKTLATKASNTTEDYENVIEKYGEYLKMLGIANILAIVLSIVVALIYVIFFGVIMASAGSSFTTY